MEVLQDVTLHHRVSGFWNYKAIWHLSLKMKLTWYLHNDRNSLTCDSVTSQKKEILNSTTVTSTHCYKVWTSPYCKVPSVLLARLRLTIITVTAGSTVLVMILWGVHFADTLSDNVAYSETITGIFKPEGQANLNMSYWWEQILHHWTQPTLKYSSSTNSLHM